MWTWPAKRFEALFGRHLVRRQRELLREQRDRMVVALSVAEFKTADDRKKAIEGAYENYNLAVEELYSGGEVAERADAAEQEMASDPLFRSVMGYAQDPIQFPHEGAGQALLER